MKLAPLTCLLAGLVLSGCASKPQVPSTEPEAVVSRPAPATATAPAAAVMKPCTTCGRIEKIDIITSTSAPVERAVLGGVVGGVLTKPATSPGAKPGVSTRSYRLTIRLESGRQLLVTQKLISPNLKIGSRVRVEGARVMMLR